MFLQYLFALAVAEACRDEMVLGKHGSSIRLKWPNDVYALDGNERKKIGGILVNTSFSGGKVDIIIGECTQLEIVRVVWGLTEMCRMWPERIQSSSYVLTFTGAASRRTAHP